jgi:hypothetical protein
MTVLRPPSSVRRIIMSSVPCSRPIAPARLARVLLMEKGIYILWCQIGPHDEYAFYECAYGWALMALSRPK